MNVTWQPLTPKDNYDSGLLWGRVQSLCKADPFISMLNDRALDGLASLAVTALCKPLEDGTVGMLILTDENQISKAVLRALHMSPVANMWSTNFAVHFISLVQQAINGGEVSIR